MKKELNERLTQVGPGTPMGEVFRRFWLPVLLDSELNGPDEEAVPFRILGQELGESLGIISAKSHKISAPAGAGVSD